MKLTKEEFIERFVLDELEYVSLHEYVVDKDKIQNCLFKFKKCYRMYGIKYEQWMNPHTLADEILAVLKIEISRRLED